MLIKEIMQTKTVTVSPETSIREVARKMRDKDVGCVLVVKGKGVKEFLADVVSGLDIRGFITDRDITCWLAEGKNPDTVQVGSMMKKEVITATPDTDVFEAGKLMSHHHVRRLPIVEDGKLCGIVTTSDLAPVIEEEIDNFLHLEETYHH